MIGLQEILLERNIKIKEFAKEINMDYSTVLSWINQNRIPNNRLKMLAEKLQVEEDYLNKKVNNISTHQPKFKGFNNYKIVDDYAIIYLVKKNGDVYETLVDAEDIDKLKQLNYCWHCVYKENTQSNYARCSVYYGDVGKKKCKMVYLHNVIMDKNENEVIDHINHDTLDNRKQNLRVTINRRNLRNRKGANSNNKLGIRNVNYIRKSNEYWVQFSKNYEKFVWKFPSDQLEEACRFAEEKRNELYGEFAGES